MCFTGGKNDIGHKLSRLSELMTQQYRVISELGQIYGQKLQHERQDLFEQIGTEIEQRNTASNTASREVILSHQDELLRLLENNRERIEQLEDELARLKQRSAELVDRLRNKRDEEKTLSETLNNTRQNSDEYPVGDLAMAKHQEETRLQADFDVVRNCIAETSQQLRDNKQRMHKLEGASATCKQVNESVGQLLNNGATSSFQVDFPGVHTAKTKPKENRLPAKTRAGSKFIYFDRIK